MPIYPAPASTFGGAVARDGQYEFNGLLINNDSWLQAEEVDGLFDLPSVKSAGDSEMEDRHGGYLGRDLLATREITMKLGVHADNDADLYLRQRAVVNAFQPITGLLPLIYQRSGIGQLYIPVRPRRLGGFTTSWKTAATKINKAMVLLVAPDPRVLASLESSQAIQIAASATSAQGNVVMAGNFIGGAWPIIEIAGPATNPRITNNRTGRTIRIDHVITAGQTLIIDTKERTVTKGGIDQFASVRNDNQWWTLLPGIQTVSWARTNNPANTATMTVRWRDSYAS